MGTRGTEPVDEVGRRKWDKDQWDLIAADRLKEDEERRALEKEAKKRPPIKRELLKPREYKVDLDSRLGKSVVITKTTPASQGGGYYCNVCDCVVKDSINFLDHINGKKHQRNLGMSMRVKKATVDDVKARFELKKQQLEEKKKDYDIQERMRELKEEEEKLNEYRRQKRLNQKKRKRGEYELDDGAGVAPTVSGDEGDMAVLMGFSGFSHGRKNN